MAGFENAIRMLQQLTGQEQQRVARERDVGEQAIPQTLAGIHKLQQFNEAKERQERERASLANMLGGGPDAANVSPNMQIAASRLLEQRGMNEHSQNMDNRNYGLAAQRLMDQRTNAANLAAHREREFNAGREDAATRNRQWDDSMSLRRDRAAAEKAARERAVRLEDEDRAAKAEKEQADRAGFEQFAEAMGLPPGTQRDTLWAAIQKMQQDAKMSPEAIEQARKLAQAEAEGRAAGTPQKPVYDPVETRRRIMALEAPSKQAGASAKGAYIKARALASVVEKMAAERNPGDPELQEFIDQMNAAFEMAEAENKKVGQPAESDMGGMSVEELRRLAGE